MRLTGPKLFGSILIVLLLCGTILLDYADSAKADQKPKVLVVKETKPVKEEVKVVKEKPKTKKPILTEEQTIDGYIEDICKSYHMDAALVKSIVWHESRYNPNAKTGSCVGLMQISTRWHAERAHKLGVTNFYDPYGNILIGVDYLSDIFENYKDPALVLMMYNMDNAKALELYNQGEISGYAKSVLKRAKDL